MPRERNEKKPMMLNEVFSFRPKEPELCDLFNQAMAATGLDRTDMAMRSIRAGLEHAVNEVFREREEAKKRWRGGGSGPAGNKR